MSRRALALPFVVFVSLARAQEPPPLVTSDGLRATVDPSGTLTLVDQDARAGEGTLARARVSGATAAGPFGRGWTLAGARLTGEGLALERGPTLAVERDAAGRITRAHGPGVDVRYAYDAEGELVETSRRRYDVRAGYVFAARGGVEFEVEHDALGRVTALRAGGRERRVSYARDGRSVTHASGGERWTLRLDDRGALERVERAWGEARAVVRPTPEGEVLDTPWGRFETRRGRDQVTVSGPFGALAIVRDAEGRRARVTWPNGVEGRWSQDRAEHRAPAGPLLRVRRAREDDVEVVRRDGRERRIARDPLGRIVSVTGPGDARRWLDPAPDGARRTVEDDGRVTWWTTDRRGRLVAAGDARLRHDDAGRVVLQDGGEGEPRARFGWDPGGRLAWVEQEDAATGARRTTTFAWSDDGRVAARGDDEGGARLLDLGPLRVTLLPGGWARVFVLDPDDLEGPPLGFGDLHADWEPEWIFLHDDGQGATLAMSDAAGRLRGQADLSPWGELVEDPGPELPVFWRGQEVDRALGLVFLDGRPYAPALGSFLAPDPLRRGAPAYLGPVVSTPAAPPSPTAGLAGALR